MHIGLIQMLQKKDQIKDMQSTVSNMLKFQPIVPSSKSQFANKRVMEKKQQKTMDLL